MRVLSLFDGMACGMLAMKAADQMVNEYVAYEIDKYATQTAQHNFPIIQEKGDVFKADFTEYEGFDWLVGWWLSLHLLVYSTDQAPRDSSKWNGMGTLLTVRESLERGKT